MPPETKHLKTIASVGHFQARKAKLNGFQARMESSPISSLWQCPGWTLSPASLNVYVCQCRGWGGFI